MEWITSFEKWKRVRYLYNYIMINYTVDGYARWYCYTARLIVNGIISRETKRIPSKKRLSFEKRKKIQSNLSDYRVRVKWNDDDGGNNINSNPNERSNWWSGLRDGVVHMTRTRQQWGADPVGGKEGGQRTEDVKYTQCDENFGNFYP